MILGTLVSSYEVAGPVAGGRRGTSGDHHLRPPKGGRSHHQGGEATAPPAVARGFDAGCPGSCAHRLRHGEHPQRLTPSVECADGDHPPASAASGALLVFGRPTRGDGGVQPVRNRSRGDQDDKHIHSAVFARRTTQRGDHQRLGKRARPEGNAVSTSRIACSTDAADRALGGRTTASGRRRTGLDLVWRPTGIDAVHDPILGLASGAHSAVLVDLPSRIPACELRRFGTKTSVCCRQRTRPRTRRRHHSGNVRSTRPTSKGISSSCRARTTATVRRLGRQRLRRPQWRTACLRSMRSESNAPCLLDRGGTLRTRTCRRAA
jgi:hypothetical protein